MRIITQREYLRRCAYREFPNLTPPQIERYLKELEQEHPDWNMSQKVNAETGEYV